MVDTTPNYPPDRELELEDDWQTRHQRIYVANCYWRWTRMLGSDLVRSMIHARPRFLDDSGDWSG